MGARGVGRAIIEVDDLSKHYGDVRAVDEVSFDVAEGEILGLLGHNGAGKTTTIRMLTGRVRPTSGHARIAGHDIVREREQREAAHQSRVRRAESLRASNGP